MKNRPWIRHLTGMAYDLGADDVSVEHGRHIRMRIAFRGREIVNVIPSSPSDRRGLRNAETELRRLMGVRRRTNKNPDRRPKPRPVQARVECPRLTVRPDPMAPLRALYEGDD